MIQLVRYWFEFNEAEDLPPSIRRGCGVTAIDYSDATNIMSQKIFKDHNMPELKTCIENIDIGKLDQGHIIPNMLAPNRRGIWFPIGYQDL